MDSPIDFAALAQALLDRAERLVPEWLRDGRRQGREWVCAGLGGGEGRSCSVNLNTGKWADFSSDDKGNDLISLYAAIHGLNQGQAARQLMEVMGWQKSTPAPAVQASEHTRDERPEPPPWEGAAEPAQKRKSMWRALLPVPPNARTPDFKHFERGLPERTWEYRFEGELHGYVCRFRTSDGGKEILPLTWCVDESDGRGLQKWHWKQWEDPRPLYVPATLLSADLQLPVVVVEGEKCAEAGHKLLGHEFDFVSWPGGGKAWAKAQWGWLMGRTVYLWPDCDAKRVPLNKRERDENVDPASKDILPEAKQPGVKAMVGIGQELLANQGCTVFMCPVPQPGAVSDGWDIADAIEAGWDAENVRAFIRGARAFVPPDDAVRAAAGESGVEKSARSRAPAEGQSGAASVDESIAWKAYLITSEKGAVKAVRENITLALDGWKERGIKGIPEADGLIAFNEFTNNVIKTRETPWGSPAGVWEEHDELAMGEWLARSHYLPSMPRSTLEEAVLLVSRQHAFHPVRQRVLTLRGRWDKTPRLEQWLRICCLVEDEYDDNDPLQRYLSCAGKWFIMAMCARVMPTVKEGTRIVRGPGTKFDYMLIFEGGQGIGKSSLAAVLGGEYFADTGLLIGEKDSYQNIQGILVYEWGELENMSRQEVSKVKLFVSSPKDRFRASFDRRPKDYPRQVVFVGTTNEAHYLTDTTGNRRFWPVRVTRDVPDKAWLEANLEQLLAEAVHRLDEGERFWPTREEQRDLFDAQQQVRMVQSSLEAAVRHYLYDETQKVPHMGQNGTLVNRISTQELLTRIGYTIDKQTDAVVKKLSAVMNMLGWELGARASKKNEDGKRPWQWVRPQNVGAADGRASQGSTPTQGTQQERATDDCPF